MNTNNEVHVLDSIGSGRSIHRSLELQIAQVYYIGQSSLSIKKISVQQRSGDTDCRLFAVAFALEICEGQDPRNLSFNQGRMSTHLFNCLQQGFFFLFSQRQGDYPSS